MALYLPRLAVLVSIEADRLGAGFTAPLGPYVAWFSAIWLSRDFKRAKVPGNPMETPFCFGVFWGVIQVDRHLMLYLPRLAVLVRIEADRAGAWFPGPLGPCLIWFPAICLSRDFKRAKVPGNLMKSLFCFGVFWGVIFKKKTISASTVDSRIT